MEMEYENLDQVMKFVRDAHATFGFHVQGDSGQSVGEEMCEAGAHAIHDLGIGQQRGGKTVSWPINSDNPPGRGYRSKKQRAYGTTLTNVRTNDGPGSLLNVESIKGLPGVTPHKVTWQYGLSQTPENHIWADDLRRTDREKAVYAHEQRRGFFELGREVIMAMVGPLFRGFKNHMERQSWK